MADPTIRYGMPSVSELPSTAVPDEPPPAWLVDRLAREGLPVPTTAPAAPAAPAANVDLDLAASTGGAVPTDEQLAAIASGKSAPTDAPISVPIGQRSLLTGGGRPEATTDLAPIEMVPVGTSASAPEASGMPAPQMRSYGGTRVDPSWQSVSRTTTPLTEQEGAAALGQLGSARAQYEDALTSAGTQLGDANEAAQIAELDRQATDRYAAEAARKRAMDRAQELGDAQRKVADGQVDPNKLLRNMSTGSAVIAGIAAIMGGIGQGLTGGQRNEAVATLQTAIDRDISAQRDNLAKNERMLDFIRARYGDEDKWLDQQRSLQYAAVDSKLRMAENMAKDADTKQRIAAARYDLTKGAISDVVQVAAQSRPQETQRFDLGGVRGGGSVLTNRAEMVAAIAARAATGDPEKDQAALERINKMPDRQIASLGAAIGLMPATGGGSGGGHARDPAIVETPLGAVRVADEKARQEVQKRAAALAEMDVAARNLEQNLTAGDDTAAYANMIQFVQKRSVANGQGALGNEEAARDPALRVFRTSALGVEMDPSVRVGMRESALNTVRTLRQTTRSGFAEGIKSFGAQPVQPSGSGGTIRTIARPK